MLAAAQRLRLEELHRSQETVEAALSGLKRGDARLAREVLKTHTAWDSARSTSSAGQPDSVQGYPVGGPRVAWSDGSQGVSPDRETPPPHYAPVWAPIPGDDDAWGPPKLALQQHIQGGGAEGDPPGMHGHCKDEDMQDGLQRGIGHGRRHIDIPDHFVGHGTAVLDRSSSHGNLKDPARLGRQRRAGAPAAERIRGFVGHEREDVSPGGFGWLGAGRRHFVEKDNMLAAGMSSEQATPTRKTVRPSRDHLQSGSGVHTPPDSEVRHGRPREAAFHDGLERFIGHGRRHRPEWVQQDNLFRPAKDVEPMPRRRPVGGADHIVPGCGQATCLEDASEPGRRHFGARDNIRAGFTVDISRCEDFIGNGKQRIPEKAHLFGAWARGDDMPGRHGHTRDDDFQDGIERGIGHGKRRLQSGFEAVKAEAQSGVRGGAAVQAVAPPPCMPRPLTPAETVPAAGAPSPLCRTAPPRCHHPKMW